MRRVLALAVVAGLFLTIPAALDAAPASSFRGLSFSTAFPTQTVRTGEPVTLSLTIKNHGLPPQRVSLRAVDVPAGWKVDFQGAGRSVRAVFVGVDDEASVSARIEPPASVRPGSFNFRLVAEGETSRAVLPVTLILGQVQPSRLSLTTELPVVRGPATSTFRFRLTLKNDSDRDLLVNLQAQAPRGFQVSFTPDAGEQEVTSIPIKAGESRDLDTEVTLPKQAAAQRHDITVRASAGDARAEAKLGVEVTGRAELTLSGPDGRLSGRATAGRATPVKLRVKNTGSATAQDVELSASEPSGWEVKFEPARLEQLQANQERDVTAIITPSSKAIAGDYMVNMTASGGEASGSADFRVTVLTSTLWGITGILLVAVALGVVSLAVSRYGRR